VEVQWAQELTTEVVTVLCGLYALIDGIDEIDMMRYRHFLIVAPHIQSEQDVAEAVQRSLLDDEELAWALNSANLGGLEVQVAHKVSDLST